MKMASRLQMRAVSKGIEYNVNGTRLTIGNDYLRELQANLFWREENSLERGFTSEQLHQLSSRLSGLESGNYNVVGIDVSEEPNGRHEDQQIFLNDNRSRGVDDYPVWIYLKLEKKN